MSHVEAPAAGCPRERMSMYTHAHTGSLAMALVTAVCVGAWPQAAWSNESRCYSIRDSDQKNHCLAMAKGQSSYCYSIRDSDFKNVCLAQTKSQKSYCYSIRANDLKNQCLALVR